MSSLTQAEVQEIAARVRADYQDAVREAQEMGRRLDERTRRMIAEDSADREAAAKMQLALEKRLKPSWFKRLWLRLRLRFWMIVDPHERSLSPESRALLEQGVAQVRAGQVVSMPASYFDDEDTEVDPPSSLRIPRDFSAHGYDYDDSPVSHASMATRYAIASMTPKWPVTDTKGNGKA